jgi:tyrosyl-tRNA synthetase
LKDEKVNPRDIKMKLAKEIVRLYHGKNEAEKAEERFKTVFQKGQMPKDIETIIIEGENFDIGEILVLNGFVKSKNELRRLVSQGGIKINNVKVDNFEDIKMENEIVIQIGKKKFIRLK